MSSGGGGMVVAVEEDLVDSLEGVQGDGAQGPAPLPDVPHSERLTEELIDAIEDVAKLRSLFTNFYKKSSAAEKEAQKFKAEQMRKLQEAESRNEIFKEELYKKIYEALEQDLNCSICSELFIQPSVLECGHTFCAYCIGVWKNGGNRACPICRQYIFRPITKHVGLGNFLTKFHTMLSQEIRDRRDQLLRERAQQPIAPQAAQVAVGDRADRALLSSAAPYSMFPAMWSTDRANNNINALNLLYGAGAVSVVPSSSASLIAPPPPPPPAPPTSGNLTTTVAVHQNPQANASGIPGAGAITASAVLQARQRNAALLERLRARMQTYRNIAAPNGTSPQTSSNSNSSNTAAVSPVISTPPPFAALSAPNGGPVASTAAPVTVNIGSSAAQIEASPAGPSTSVTSSPFYQSLVAEIETLRQNLNNRRAEADLVRFEEDNVNESARDRDEFRVHRYNPMFGSQRTHREAMRSMNRNSAMNLNDRSINLDSDGWPRALALHRTSRSSQSNRTPRHRSRREATDVAFIPLPPPSRYSSDNNRNNRTPREVTVEPTVRIEYGLPDSENNRDRSSGSGSRTSRIPEPDDWAHFDPLEIGDMEFVDNMEMQDDEDNMLNLL